MSTTEKKRLSYIDIAKGFAMILVLFGHCSYCPAQLEVWLYSFHMPLFFALSGITFSIGKGNFKEFLIKKTKGFLVPYALLSLTLWILIYPSRIIRGGFKMKYFKSLIGIVIGYRHTDYYYTMWFILALFVAELVLFFVVKLIENKKLWIKNVSLLAFIALFVLIGYVVVQHVDGFIWSLDIAPFAFVFLAFGYLIKLNIELFYKLSKIYIVLFLLLGNLGITYLNFKKSGYFVDLYYGKLGNLFYYLLASVLGLCFALSLCYIIKKFRFLEYIGKNTLVFYAFQHSLVIPFCKQMTKYFFKAFNLEFNRDIMFVIIMVMSIIILSAMSEIINRYMPVLLGRNNQNKTR